MDPLEALHEPELRAQMLQMLCGTDRKAASLVCRAWRDAVNQVPVSHLKVSTNQIRTEAFLQWLREHRHGSKVLDFEVTQEQACVGELCMAVAHARRMLTRVERYIDPISQQVEKVIAELPQCVRELSLGTPATVTAVRVQLSRLTNLQTLSLEAGFYQELCGLPVTLQRVFLHRNVVYVRLIGNLENVHTFEAPVYEQGQLAAACTLPSLRRARLHLYAGVGLSLTPLARLAKQLEHLELRVYGAALQDTGVLAQMSRLDALAIDIDLSFYGPSAAPQETAVLENLRLPPALRRLRIARSCSGQAMPPSLVQRITAAMPALSQVDLASHPQGWSSAATCEWVL